MVQAELDAQLRLLTIAYRQANLTRATALMKLKLAVAANRKVPGTVTKARLEILKHDVDSAALGIERAKTLYDVYEKLRRGTSFPKPSSCK